MKQGLLLRRVTAIGKKALTGEVLLKLDCGHTVKRMATPGRTPKTALCDECGTRVLQRAKRG